MKSAMFYQVFVHMRPCACLKNEEESFLSQACSHYAGSLMRSRGAGGSAAGWRSLFMAFCKLKHMWASFRRCPFKRSTPRNPSFLPPFLPSSLCSLVCQSSHCECCANIRLRQRSCASACCAFRNFCAQRPEADASRSAFHSVSCFSIINKTTHRQNNSQLTNRLRFLVASLQFLACYNGGWSDNCHRHIIVTEKGFSIAALPPLCWQHFKSSH